MTVLEAKVDALVRLALTQDIDERHKELTRLELLAEGVLPENAVEDEIHGFLMELGVSGQPKGGEQLVSALKLAVEEPQLLGALFGEFYPRVAKACGASCGQRIERNIRHCIEKLWDEGNPKVLNQYFKGSISIHTGRPSTGAFLNKACREIRRRLGRLGG